MRREGIAVKHSFRRALILVATLGCASFLAPATRAQDRDAPPEPKPPGKVSAEVGFALYAWLPSIGGVSAVDGMATDFDASFFDLLDDSDSLIGFMGHAELNINRFLILFDPVWTKMTKDDVGEPGTDVDATLQTLWVDVDVGYRFIDNATIGGEESSVRVSVDGFAGFRISDFKIQIHDQGPEGGFTATEVWADPLVGGRVTLDFGNQLGMVLRADIGGFGAGSKSSSGMAGIVGYRFPIGEFDAALFAGYKALYQDYEDGGFEWRAWVHGPLLGFQIYF